MKNNDLFLSTFVNEWVDIMTDLVVNQEIGSDEGVVKVTAPMTVTGMIKDYDGDMVYLSSDGHSVDQGLPYVCIKHISIMKTEEEVDELSGILDEIEGPDSPEGYN